MLLHSLFAIPQVAAGQAALNHRKIQKQAKCMANHAEK
jgi:hypothetical protein